MHAVADAPIRRPTTSRVARCNLDGYGIKQDVPETPVLDPFCGTGTTMLAALKTGRNSIGIEIDPEYCRMTLRRLDTESGPLFGHAAIEYHTAAGLLAPTTAVAVADKPASRPTPARRRRRRKP